MITLLCLVCALAATGQPKQPEKYPLTGYVERFDPALDALVSPGTRAEIIATGFDWSEGPLWIARQKMLLFSDVPQNTIYKWTEAKGIEKYLNPSGYTDTAKRGGETGSNGLILDEKERLLLAQCGNRQIARMEAAIDAPMPQFHTLANRYGGNRFNSPNDLVINSRGEIFFTDPPYGLEKYMSDPKKETPYQGVYKISTSGKVILLTDSITRPNGIAFLPGEKTLLVANSDPAKPNWYAYDISDDGRLVNARIFATAKGSDKKLKGSPDGMKVDKHGNVFATGPGGIWIFNKEGKLLGKLRIDETPVSNCAFSEDEKTLYATSDGNILRFQLRPHQ
ncbi:SMP-30/gluconolactonase/LRE family protein [Sediminibacterium soli]|uniref:SMP-30/gluconolactonase/LRE family protein n=1 Tax=Sediminibacterium soli TaxID=2698829 RepID=UPI0013793E07|nr:SMP-30/gluconolactonase/LRE family protein [Sediminibacterium soli]NCI45745.1 SMP-30/gluconolactonase/LRE family protein [Sediminibacterium soli]